MAPARGMFRPEPTIKHVRMVPETHMLRTIKHCVPRRKTLTRRATAERWENTIFRPTIYHQAFIHVCLKNYQIIVIFEAKTLCKINKIIDFLIFLIRRSMVLELNSMVLELYAPIFER